MAISKGTGFGLLSGTALLAVVLVQLVWTCSELEDRAEDERTPPEDMVVQRELGAAYFAEDDFARARENLAAVAEQRAASAQDLVNAACVDLADADSKQGSAKDYLERAVKLDSELPSVHYCLGLVSVHETDFEKAAEHFSRAVELAPEDVPTRLQYADALENTDRPAEALEQYQHVLDLGLEYTGSYYVTALYRKSTILMRDSDESRRTEGREIRMHHQHLTVEQGLKTPSAQDLERGVFANVRVPRPTAWEGRGAEATELGFEKVHEGVGAEAGAPRAVAAGDLDGDREPDLVICGDEGVVVALRRPGQDLVTKKVSDGVFDKVALVDLRNEARKATEPQDEAAPSDVHPRRLGLVLCGGGQLRWLAPDQQGGYHDFPLPRVEARDFCPVDYDHDGDLDLLLATDEGLVLLRNDGAPREKLAPEQPLLVTMIDVSDPRIDPGHVDLPKQSYDWVDIEDFDHDNDIDFIAGGAEVDTVLLSNLRKGRFEAWDPATSGLPARLPRRPTLVDLDYDGDADLWAPGVGFCRNRDDGRFEAAKVIDGLAEAGAAAVAADLNLDGWWDLVTTGENGWRAALGSVLTEAVVQDLGVPAVGALAVVADLDRDGDPDLVGAAERGVDVYRNALTLPPGAVLVELQGGKDNRQAIGAVLEVRAGEQFHRSLYRGLPTPLGFLEGIDVMRVSWPNGVIQNSTTPFPTPADEKLVALKGRHLHVFQMEGLAGSCPFLYTFDGERHHFISDILGITPLGLPMEEGMYVPPDHDELVRIRGDQLAPVDGEYRMHITEELREVTYLDRVQLWVVDHPADVLVHPEERFCFPPFPPQKIHTVREPRALLKAIGSDGEDWTEALAHEDGRHAAPFQPLSSQFLGLATDHHLDLHLPPEVEKAEKVRLMMTGWFYWTDASVNVATGHHADIAFVPPTLSVPDGAGGWRPAGPPIGFPAGKTKTMMIDVSEMIDREDRRLRLSSTLRLYWDQIAVCVDDDDAEYQLTKLEPRSAKLAYRGFSKRLPPRREHQPEQFVFEEMRDYSPWNQHRGMLTRYGEVVSLLGEIDDQFAVFSAGDAIDLRFDATGIPALADGMSRTFLLFADGWAKDDDPNTWASGTVEPLPFHGMSGYPYREDESYPMDAAHREYLETWNTRPGRELIPSLAPSLSQKP